jgi:hypothetical protein
MGKSTVLASQPSLFWKRLAAKKGESQRRCLQGTTFIILSYMSYKSQVQYFDKKRVHR